VRLQLFADHLRQDFAGRQRCHAVRQITRDDRRRSTRSGATRCTPQIARPASTGAAYTVSCVFEMRCVAWRSKIRADGGRAGATKAGLLRTGPSSAAEAVLRCCQTMRTPPRQGSSTRPPTKAATQGPQQSMEEGAIPARTEGGGLNVPRHTTTRRMVRHLRHEFTGMTVSGCGTGLIHCRGQTGRQFAAEMR
jgi:hypothetical protein